MLEFMSHNQMYIVLFVVLLVWSGIVMLLLRLEKRIRLLENQNKKD